MLKLCTERKKGLKYLFVQRPTIPLWLISWEIKEVLSAEGEVEESKRLLGMYVCQKATYTYLVSDNFLNSCSNL